MYAIITNSLNYVSIDLTVFVDLDSVKYGFIYLMKDKSVEVKVEKNGLWVEIHTSNSVHQLDMNGVHGVPAKVGNVTPNNNFVLGERIAELKNL